MLGLSVGLCVGCVCGQHR